MKFSRHEGPYNPPKRDFSQHNFKWALVLGAGGTKGVAHIGVIEEIEKEGLRPDLIVGCSAGAIVGALYSDTGSIDYAKKLMSSTKMGDLISYTIKKFELLNTNEYEAFLSKNLKSKTFEDLKIPYVNVATNLEFGNLSVFSSGDLLKPVLASSSVPGAMRPQMIGGQYFVDGAIFDPVPVQVAKSFGADFVIAVDISELLTKSAPKHFMGVIKRSSEISYISQIKSSLKEADYVIGFDLIDIGTFTDEHSEFLYQLGRQAGRKSAIEIKSLLKKRGHL